MIKVEIISVPPRPVFAECQFPRDSTLRYVPHYDHSLNSKMAPFAYQTQTVADPYHIYNQFCPADNPFCKAKESLALQV